MIDSVWLKNENGCKHINESLINFIKDFCYLKNKPCEAPEGWINKELLLDNKIIHIRGGGGWCYHKEEYHIDCLNLIKKYINKK